MVQNLFMSEQDLVERATINFPRSIDFKEVKKVLRHLRDNIGKDLRINAGFKGYLYIGKEREESYVSEVSGLMTCLMEDGYVITSFSFLRDKINLSGNFSGLRFEPPVGYDLDEVDRTELRLYGLTRESLKEYFDNS